MDSIVSVRAHLARALPWAALGAMMVALDLPLSRLRPELSAIDPTAQLLTIPELFGDGWGVVLILASLFLIAPGVRRRLLRVALATSCAGLTATLVKLMVWRVRPKAFEMQSSADGILATFQGCALWTPWIHPDFQWERWMTSFPSAHTATAVGLACGLSWLYPRWTRVFAGLVVAVAVQRVVVGAHFPSDTFFGAAVGMCVAPCHFQRWWATRWLDQFETPGQPCIAAGALGARPRVLPRAHPRFPAPCERTT